VVRRILSAEGEAKPIEPTSTIVVEGESLAADAVSVRISGVDVPDAVTSVTDSEIRVDVAPAIAAGVRAGVQVLQVVHSRSLDEDDPQALRPLTESNAESFVLRPAISAPTPMGLDNGVTVKAGEIEVTFVPNVGVSQRVVLLLNELAPAGGAAPRAYSFAAPQGNGIVAPAVDTEKVRFPFKRVIPGTYLVRARVDGADSRLKIENEAFAKPTVTI
jgi:hypothetical protein